MSGFLIGSGQDQRTNNLTSLKFNVVQRIFNFSFISLGKFIWEEYNSPDTAKN